MAKLQRRPFGDADNVRAVPYGSLETYDLGELRVGRSVLEPGWRWSNSIKPISRTEWCEYHHFGLCMAGTARVTMREGSEMVIEAGQLYEIPPFHDIEVIGDEPYVTVNWNPSPGLGELEGGDFDRVVATLLMTDIVDSTPRARELGDARWRELLARHNMVVRGLLERFRGREVTTTGDGFVATFDGAERAIRAGLEISRAVAELGLEVRAGVHTGELELEGDDVRGLNVHIAARVMGLAGPGEVYASWATRELLAGSSVTFVDRGLQEMKGLAEPRRVYLVEPTA
jgi:class 3 adenylate cyclase